MVVVYGQQYNFGEKPTDILYTYIIAIQVHRNIGKKSTRWTNFVTVSHFQRIGSQPETLVYGGRSGYRASDLLNKEKKTHGEILVVVHIIYNI